MTPQTQAFLHKPHEGVIGDCWRTCIACVLDVPRDDVPHGFGLAWKDGEVVTEQAHVIVNDWLAPRGFRFIEFPLECSREQLGVYLSHYMRDMHVVIGCNSRNGGHSVVMRNDDYMWDPSIDGSGCVGPMDDGYWWVGLLVKETR